MRLRSKKSAPSLPLLALNALGDVIDALAFLTHLFICGQTGAGKSSIMRVLLNAACRYGAGIICPTYKVDAADDIEKWARDAGRGSSVIRWNGRNYGLNLFQYFLSRFGVEGMNSVVEAIFVCIDIIKQSTTGLGREGDEFFSSAGRNHIAGSIPIVFAATGTVTVDSLLRFLRTAPQNADQVQSAEWRAQSYFFQLFAQAQGKIDEATYQRCLEYWQFDFSTLEARAKTSIHITVVTALSRLTQGLLHDAFSRETSIVPEICFLGGVLILDAPYALHGTDGLIFQKIALFCAQEAVKLRPTYQPHLRDRLMLFMIDEAQEYVSFPQTNQFLAIARSHNAGVVMATQSLPTLTARCSGPNAEQQTYDLLSHFGTKLFLTSGDPTSNRYASDLCGRSLQWRDSYSGGDSTSSGYSVGVGEGTSWGNNSGSGGSSSHSSSGGSYGSSWSSGTSNGGNDSSNRSRNSGTSRNSGWSRSQHVDVAVEPAFFTHGLRTGGIQHGGVVDGLLFRSGHIFKSSGTNYTLVSFQQPGVR